MKATKTLALATTLLTGTVLAASPSDADGSKEAGFVAPPREKKLPSAPPRTSSSAETYCAGGCSVPMSRTESKKPPTPPVLVTKVKE
jgi:hypothetical protein